MRSHRGVEPIHYSRHTNNRWALQERRHQKPSSFYARQRTGSEHGHVYAETFQDRLFDRNHRRDGRLGVRLWSGRHCSHEMAVSLIEYSKAFAVAQPTITQRATFTSNANIIACLLFLIFEDFEATNARHGTKFQQAIKANLRLCTPS